MNKTIYWDNIYADATKTLNLILRDLRTLPADIIETYCLCTQHVDLSQNRLSDLSWLTEFVELKELILDNNRLCETHLKRLTKPMPKVTVLMLNKNEFGDLNETIEHIARLFPNLEHLSLHGNALCPDGLGLRPFSEYVTYDCEFYCAFISSELPNLKFLDHASTKVTDFSDYHSTKSALSILKRSKQLLKKLSLSLKSTYGTLSKVYNKQCYNDVVKNPYTNINGNGEL